MTDCDADALSQFVDGELSPARFREVANHLRACARCRRELADLRRINATLIAWGSQREPVSAAAETRVQKSLERRGRLKPLFALSRMMPAAVGTSVAAILVLVSANLATLYQSAPHDTQQAPPVVSLKIRQQSTPLLYARVKTAVLSPHGVVEPSRPVDHVRLSDIY